MTPIAWAVLILAIGLLVTSILVLVAKNLVAIISAVGLGSVILAIIFFSLESPFAGAIELSVGAGLISVLFIIATSVTDRAADEVE